MEIKSGPLGADIRFWTARAWGAALIGKFLWMEMFPAHPYVITSGIEGDHMDGSKHFVGDAGDIRTQEPGGNGWKLTSAERSAFRQEFDRRTGDEYQVTISKAGNIHFECDPTKRTR